MFRYSMQYENLIVMADLYTAAGEYKTAEEYYRRAGLADPRQSAPYIGRGIIELHSGQLEKAWNDFETARMLNPACSRAYCGLAMVCQCKGLLKEAKSLYCKCLDLDGDNITALLGLLHISRLTGSVAALERYFYAYLEIHPQDTAIMFCLASLYAYRRRFSAAESMLMSILNITPDHASAIELLQQLPGKTICAKHSNTV